MRYALLIYWDEETAVSDRERKRREEQFTALNDGLRARGAPADTQRLPPARAARTVRCWDGAVLATDDQGVAVHDHLVLGDLQAGALRWRVSRSM
jgi:hypothetical protein